MEQTLSLFNDGISDSGILFILVLIDTTLAVSYQIKQKQHLLSSTLLSGLLRNFVLCFMPFLVHELAAFHPRTDNVYQLIAAVLSVFIGYAVIQSILAYTALWGISYPQWLKDWLSNEIMDKENKNGDIIRIPVKEEHEGDVKDGPNEQNTNNK